jgi:Spy/CpxP family protein refolding chaperone
MPTKEKIMHKLAFIGLFLIAIALITAPAFAKRHAWTDMEPCNSKPTERIEQLKLLLDLSPDQEAEINEIINDSRKEAQQQRESHRANRQEVRELINAENLNETRLRELVQAQAEEKLERMVRRHETRSAINRVLTPEQQEKSQALHQMRRDRKGYSKCATSSPDVRDM